MAKDTICTEKAAELLWEEWKYRHDTLWENIFRWGVGVGIVSFVPWVNPDIINRLRGNILIFPIVASMMALFASWYIASEYTRILRVRRRYKKVIGDYALDPERPEKRITDLPIGWVLAVIFLILALPISGLNAYLLFLEIS